MRALVVLPILGLLAFPACGDDSGGGDDLEAFCAILERQQAAGDPFEVLASGSRDEIETTMNELKATLAEAADVVPEAVADDLDLVSGAVDEAVDVLEQHDYDLRAAAEDLRNTTLTDPARQEELNEAGQRLEFYGEIECGLEPEGDGATPGEGTSEGEGEGDGTDVPDGEGDAPPPDGGE